MDENTTIVSNSGPQKSKRLWMVAVILILVAVLAGFWLLRNNKNQQISNKSLYPSYFVEGAQDIKSFTVTDKKEYFLSKGQSIDQGEKFKVEKPYLQTVKEYIGKLEDNGWAAVAGSSQTKTQTLIKMGKGTEGLFIKIEADGSNPNIAWVTIIPIKRTN